MATMSLLARFAQKVRIGPHCHEWLGAKNAKGYGVINLGRRGAGVALAHRVAFELGAGEIPPGAVVMHRCDNPGCVNPRHLKLATQWENLQDMGRKGRQTQQRGITCGNGHPKTPENWIAIDESHGRCLICRRAAKRRYKVKVRTGARSSGSGSS
jgi:hypothetical protein